MGTDEALGMQTPSVRFARLVPFLSVQQPGDEHIFLWVPQCQQWSTLVSLVAAASLVRAPV